MFDIQKSKMIASVCLISFVLLFTGFLVFVPVATADEPVVPVVPPADTDLFGVDVVGSQTGLTGGEDTDLRAMIGSIIKTILGFLGVVAVVIVLIGGFKYMTAGGSDEKVKEARKWIISGIIGLAIIIAAYAITSYVISELMTAVEVAD